MAQTDTMSFSHHYTGAYTVKCALRDKDADQLLPRECREGSGLHAVKVPHVAARLFDVRPDDRIEAALGVEVLERPFLALGRTVASGRDDLAEIAPDLRCGEMPARTVCNHFARRGAGRFEMELDVKIEKELRNFILRADFTLRDEVFALLGASGCGGRAGQSCYRR